MTTSISSEENQENHVYPKPDGQTDRHTDGQTDGRTDGRAYRRTDGRADGRTLVFVE